MGLETGTFISDLVVTNPPTSDLVAQGDDHIRLVKTVAKNTFPNATKAFYFPTVTTKSADFTVAAAELNTTYLVNTSGGDVVATLPTLASGDAGFSVSFSKIGNNVLFIVPASGALNSGPLALTRTRRCIPIVPTWAIWLGSSWALTRAVDTPVGGLIPYAGSSLPQGFEWPNGQTLSSSTNYPDYNNARGGLTTPDIRGRVIAGKDDMGGSSANRLTNQAGGLNGDTFEATGGGETHTLVTAELAAHSHGVTDLGHGHPGSTAPFQGAAQYAAGAGGPPVGPGGATGITIANNTTGIAINNAGSGSAHNNVQPTIIENYLLVVE